MKSESTLVYVVWEIVRDFIPAARRVDSAISLMRCFEEFGFEKDDFLEAADEDETLRSACNLVFNSDDEEEEEDDYDHDPYEL